MKFYNKKGKFNITAIFNKYTNNNKLLVIIKKNFLDLLIENEEYVISYDLIRLDSDDGCNYYLEYD